jgi:hypothetical protein
MCVLKTLLITYLVSFILTSLPQTCAITCAKCSCICLQCQLHWCIIKHIFTTFFKEMYGLGKLWLIKARILMFLHASLKTWTSDTLFIGISESVAFQSIPFHKFAKAIWRAAEPCSYGRDFNIPYVQSGSKRWH